MTPIQAQDITGESNPASKTFLWVQYSPRVAQIQAAHFPSVSYLQFPDWESAHRFFRWVTSKHRLRCQVREAQRFAQGWECKVWGVSDYLLERLVQRDRARSTPRQMGLFAPTKEINSCKQQKNILLLQPIWSSTNPQNVPLLKSLPI